MLTFYQSRSVYFSTWVCYNKKRKGVIRLNGKSVSIPFGMTFKKYYCSKCGTKLEKEKTHRVVTKDDWDYYQYHDSGKFPKRDYDVYSYRFKCPSCKSRISFNEQCIIERIQKKHKSIILSADEIKESYESSKAENNKRVLLRNILTSVILFLTVLSIYYFAADKTLADLPDIAIMFAVCTVFAVFAAIRNHNGKGKIKYHRSYSHEKESRMERLHTYASNNRELVERADKCYCFHCKSVFESSQIERYLNEEATAICPICSVDSVIPDSIDEKIDEAVISEMCDYWF